MGPKKTVKKKTKAKRKTKALKYGIEKTKKTVGKPRRKYTPKKTKTTKKTKTPKTGAKRGRKRKTPETRKIVRRKKQVKKPVEPPKKQKPLMWEAFYNPQIEKIIYNWDHKWERKLDSNRVCPNFLIDYTPKKSKTTKMTKTPKTKNYTQMTFDEKIYHLQNELSLKSDKYRNDKDWIKELYDVCLKEIRGTKKILRKVYESKKYFKPISNKGDGENDQPTCEAISGGESHKQPKQMSSLAVLDQELHAFGLNLPVWIGCRNETVLPGCMSIPKPKKPLQKKASKKHDIFEGQYVAAYVIVDQKLVYIPDRLTGHYLVERNFVYENLPDESQIESNFTNLNLKYDGSWILARCIRRPEGKRKTYLVADVDDLDDDEDDYESLPGLKIYKNSLPYFQVPRQALIPLPMYVVDPDYNPEAIFPVGADVLALYKETTSFFPAVVEETPKSVTDTYKLCFKDENQVQNQVYEVLQKYVLEYKDVSDIFTQKEIIQLYSMKKVEV